LLTYEDVTGYFLKAAASLPLVTHPEYWLNSRSLEREFTCTCHIGSCEEAEQRSSSTVSFSWGPLDTALSLEGPTGVCDFFHEPDQSCAHLRTRTIPPLVLDLTYTLALNGAIVTDETLLSLAQMLRLHASEHSRRTVETQSGVSMVLQHNQLRPDVLTLQQRVELPIWHPEGMRGLHDDAKNSIRPYVSYKERSYPDETEEDDDRGDLVVDDPHPEEWLPQAMVEVCQDIFSVLKALDAIVIHNTPDNVEQ
jgi:hypothetical protein